MPLQNTTVSCVALVLVVLVAGCGAGPTATAPAGSGTTTTDTASPEPTASPTLTPTQTASASPEPAETVRVERGSVPVDADRVWFRVTDIMDADVEAPSVHVYPVEDLGEQTSSRQQLRFLSALGVTAPDDPVAELNRSLGALTFRSGRVNVYLDEGVSASAVECLLAHEFAHVVQFRRGMGERTLRGVRRNVSDGQPDTFQVYRALLEGAAMTVQRAYAAEYGCSGASPYGSWVASDDPWTQQTGAPYYYGERYLNATHDTPANLSAVAEDPPKTTEQILHPARDDEPATLSVNVTGDTAGWTENLQLRLGELLIRNSLTAGVSKERAARAAAGWGNDRLVRFFEGNDRGWVWALRWDDAANASEFADTFRAYLDARGERVDDGWVTDDGTHWRVVRTADRTVAVVAGAEQFVDAVAVEGGADVQVTINESSSASVGAAVGTDATPHGTAPPVARV